MILGVTQKYELRFSFDLIYSAEKSPGAKIY